MTDVNGVGDESMVPPLASSIERRNALQDLMVFVVMDQTRQLASEGMAPLGDQIKIVERTLKALDTGHRIATLPFVVDTDGVPVGGGEPSFFQRVIDSIVELRNMADELTKIIRENQLSPTVIMQLDQIVSDLDEYDLRSGTPQSQFGNFLKWYADARVQNNYPRAIQAAAGVSRRLQNDIKGLLFILEYVFKGGGSLLSSVDQSISSLTQGLGS